MKFDHTKFFDGFKPFYTSVTGLQLDSTKVQALDFLLIQFEQEPLWTLTAEIAYAIATTHIETFIPKTGQRYEPIKEFGGKTYFIKRYWINLKIRKQLGNKSEYDAWARCGRGFVQETGLANDTKFTKLLGIDLVSNPELAMDPPTSFKIMTVGMFNGVFTGKKIGDFINSSKTDFFSCRTVINGHDRAAEIAGYAHSIQKILDDAQITDIAPDNDKPSPPDKSDDSTSQGETVDVTSANAYNGIGFIPTIKKDLAAITGGNIGTQSVTAFMQQLNGLPPWAAALAAKIATIVIIASVIYLSFRIIHYIIFRISDGQRMKLEANAQTSKDKFSIRWIDPVLTK